MNGGSSSSSGRQFDVSSEHGILELLKAVRHSALDPESKDEIRDCVFGLSNGASPERLALLESLISPLGFTLQSTETTPAETAVKPNAEPQSTAPVEPAQPKPTDGLPTGRRTPTFAPNSTATAPASATPAPTPTTEPSAPAPSPAAEPVKPTAPTAETAAAEPTPAEAQTSSEEPASEAAAAPALTGDAQARIDEIKHRINEAVGNPVNLIDATNEVGREYMNALLEAMKAVQGGGDSAAAMARLETAFAAVEQSLASADTSAAATATEVETATPAPEPTIEPSTPVQPVAAAPTPASTPASTPVPQAEPVEPPAPVAEAPTSAPIQSVAAAPTPATPQPAAAPAEAVSEPKAAPTAPEPPAANAPASGTTLRSVAAAAASAPQSAATPASSSSAEATSDPLMSEEVTNGLAQLLNEWKLFAGGGLLGGRAKGMDHPLFATMRSLPMNLVIAGRFEGATPTVKQSIHDYMNGWRYEHGITHELKETFEHYLRRVVKTIIDKQPKDQ